MSWHRGIEHCVGCYFINEWCTSLHRDYFAEDDGEMVPRTSHAAGKEVMDLSLLYSWSPADHKSLKF